MSPVLKQVPDCWGLITQDSMYYGVTSPTAEEHCAVEYFEITQSECSDSSLACSLNSNLGGSYRSSVANRVTLSAYLKSF